MLKLSSFGVFVLYILQQIQDIVYWAQYIMIKIVEYPSLKI